MNKNMKSWLVVVILFIVGSLYADNLSITRSVLLTPGQSKEVTIQLNKMAANYTAFQFDMILPDGVQVAGVESGNLFARLNAERIVDHQLHAAKVKSNTYRFLAFSMTNANFSSSDGDLLHITLSADKDLDNINSTLLIQSQEYVEADGTVHTIGNLSFPISVVNGELTPITISSAKQSTYCSDKNLEFTGLPELKAYVATGYDKTTGTIWLTRVKDVPANTGFLLMGDPNTYDIPVKEGVSDSYYENLFKGTLTSMKLQATDGANTNYYLSNGSYGVGFYKPSSDGVDLGANRAYLSVPTDIQAVGAAGGTETINVSSALQMTYCSSNSLDFTDQADVKAYTATGYNYNSGTIWLTRVKKVPAGTGILIMAPEGSYPITKASVASVYANMFVGTLEGKTIQTEENINGNDYINYYLSAGTYGVGFYKVTQAGGVSLSPNRSYLPIPKRAAAAGTRGISSDTDRYDVRESDDVIAIRLFNGADATRGINMVKSGEVKTEKCFNLQGQRVLNPGKGLYIKNGKMVIIK